MKIVVHRGGASGHGFQPNSMDALKFCLEHGHGIETDLRDFCGRLVISHDMSNAAAPLVEELFSYARSVPDCTLALNIKADGIADILCQALAANGLKNYFAFDMSVPQMLTYRAKGLRFFTRRSEYEQAPVLYEDADGVWIDAFETEQWIQEDMLAGYLADGKEVCLVSPELHGRPHQDFWETIASWKTDMHHVMLCTDFMDEAEKFFEGAGK